MQDDRIRGQNLWRASATVAEAWRETNAMLDELSELILRELPNRIGVSVKLEEEDHESLAEGWAFPSRLLYWSLAPKKPGRPKPCGWLHATACIGPNEQRDMRFGERPTLTLGFYGSKVETREDGSAIRIDDPEFDLDGTELRGNGRLLASAGAGVRLDDPSSDWCFVVPLFSLSSAEALKSLMVEPVVALLLGRDPDQVFGEDCEALRFNLSESDELTCVDLQAS